MTAEKKVREAIKGTSGAAKRTVVVSFGGFWKTTRGLRSSVACTGLCGRPYAQEFAELGLTDRTGKPPSPKVAKLTWERVCKKSRALKLAGRRRMPLDPSKRRPIRAGTCRRSSGRSQFVRLWWWSRRTGTSRRRLRTGRRFGTKIMGVMKRVTSKRQTIFRNIGIFRVTRSVGRKGMKVSGATPMRE